MNAGAWYKTTTWKLISGIFSLLVAISGTIYLVYLILLQPQAPELVAIDPDVIPVATSTKPDSGNDPPDTGDTSEKSDKEQGSNTSQGTPEDKPVVITPSITFPLNGATVPDTFTVSGKIGDIPEGHYVWFAEQCYNLRDCKKGELWPKGAIQPNLNTWSTIYSDDESTDSGKKITVVLIMVDTDGNEYIRKWVDQINGIIPSEHSFVVQTLASVDLVVEY